MHKLTFNKKNLVHKSTFEVDYTFFFSSLGRIAQLVERLSYTQVAIGSSPVAPIA